MLDITVAGLAGSKPRPPSEEPRTRRPGPDLSDDTGLDEDFDAFYEYAYPWVISRLCGYFTGLDYGAAHDAAQDAFIACGHRRANLRSNTLETRRKYVFTAAVNIIKDRHKKDGRMSTWDPEADLEGAAYAGDPFHEVPDRVTVIQSIDRLPEQQRRVLLAYHYVQMTVAEIASCMGISKRTVRTHLDRAEKKLRQDLRRESR